MSPKLFLIVCFLLTLTIIETLNYILNDVNDLRTYQEIGLDNIDNEITGNNELYTLKKKTLLYILRLVYTIGVTYAFYSGH